MDNALFRFGNLLATVWRRTEADGLFQRTLGWTEMDLQRARTVWAVTVKLTKKPNVQQSEEPACFVFTEIFIHEHSSL
jgi:hypothetical protein